MNGEPTTISIKETKKESGLSHTTVYKLIKEGKLQTVKVGRRHLVVYASLKRLLTPKVAHG